MWPERTSDESDDHLGRDVLGLSHLAQRHRPRDAADGRLVDVAARHRRLGPAGSDRVDPRPGRHARDLVLQRQQQPALEGRLRGRVVRVPRLAEPARGRADEHERAVARAGDLAQERPRDRGAVPVLGPVRAACEMLGLDPLYVANEGVAVAIVAPEDVDAILAAAREDAVGPHAAVIGEVAEGPARVSLRTGLGATRPMLMLAGDQLPRIC